MMVSILKKILVVVAVVLICKNLGAQEVLLPLRYSQVSPSKSQDTMLTIPFFDDFSNRDAAYHDSLWDMRGAFVNMGYAPLPPTVGMVTLDAFDAEGKLYPQTRGDSYFGDTLLSKPLRLDSVFYPYNMSLTADDSIYLSFYYLPGGGFGNMWERIGDVPESKDSLLLEFYSPVTDCWTMVWSREGEPVDSIIAHTGSAWQYVTVPITHPDYLKAGFRFRFRNYCSLDNVTKTGLLSNADQWNLDYIVLDRDRRYGNRFSRDVAFVNPAPSMLKRYQAMPYNQFSAADMKDSFAITITNLFSQELATNYGYEVFDENGTSLYRYDGGFENTPAFFPDFRYQESPAHSCPPVDYDFPSFTTPQTFDIVQGLREGVGGDAHASNDTVVFRQVFDNYYAYDDGVAENGYGITSTSSRVRLATRFSLRQEDTLTAVDMYFNRTFGEENGSIFFKLTIWDDAGGHPGNVIYQDETRRKPIFKGFNQYVRYMLETPVVCSGVIYVGMEQTSTDYINLGFDRNNDASSEIFYLTSSDWQTSILRGALMLRPYFGARAVVSIDAPAVSSFKAYYNGKAVCVDNPQGLRISIYNMLGQPIKHFSERHGMIQNLPKGLYFVKSDMCVQKVIVY